MRTKWTGTNFYLNFHNLLFKLKKVVLKKENNKNLYNNIKIIIINNIKICNDSFLK